MLAVFKTWMDAEEARWFALRLRKFLAAELRKEIVLAPLDQAEQYEKNGELAVLVTDKEGRPVPLPTALL